MEFLNTPFTETEIYGLEIVIGDWIYVVSMLFLGFELIKLFARKALSWNIIGDAIANFLTLVGMIGISLAIFSFYLGIFYLTADYLEVVQLPINGWTILAALILADIAYYWEHRFMHRVGFGWATHAVHHSSPYFNISVAYRFGPLDSIIPIFFHLPLVLMGLNPILILFAEAMVQGYQTLLHTETIGKFPRPIEYLMNTPSHHRVHHGSNPQYLDKNYGGIFIIWDRMFGTFEEEKEKVVYGVTEPINSVNPLVVFFCGFTWLAKRMWNAPGLGNKIKAFFLPPDWEPKKD
ncbi:sterol desaturase family protein [Kordiimonas laminariae]|uniref:sterol desaturase family protein n=1 Tax=Kordiimonas laminariae TaxID=2917717 RepID=UPI003CCFE66C